MSSSSAAGRARTSVVVLLALLAVIAWWVWGRGEERAIEASSHVAAAPRQLDLLHRAQTSRFELPLRWHSFESYERTGPDPTPRGNGRFDLPVRKTSDDVVIMPEGELQAALAGLPAAGADAPVEMPTDGRLVLHWVPGAEVVTIRNAEWLTGRTPPASVIRSIELDWPEELAEERPREQYAPQEVRKCVTAYDASVPPWRRSSERVGLGFAGIFELGGYFSAGGELASGPDDTVAWLNVARDETGDYWFWYSEA